MSHPADDFDPFAPAIFDLVKIINFFNIQQVEFSAGLCSGTPQRRGQRYRAPVSFASQKPTQVPGDERSHTHSTRRRRLVTDPPACCVPGANLSGDGPVGAAGHRRSRPRPAPRRAASALAYPRDGRDRRRRPPAPSRRKRAAVPAHACPRGAAGPARRRRCASGGLGALSARGRAAPPGPGTGRAASRKPRRPLRASPAARQPPPGGKRAACRLRLYSQGLGPCRLAPLRKEERCEVSFSMQTQRCVLLAANRQMLL